MYNGTGNSQPPLQRQGPTYNRSGGNQSRCQPLPPLYNGSVTGHEAQRRPNPAHQNATHNGSADGRRPARHPANGRRARDSRAPPLDQRQVDTFFLRDPLVDTVEQWKRQPPPRTIKFYPAMHVGAEIDCTDGPYKEVPVSSVRETPYIKPANGITPYIVPANGAPPNGTVRGAGIKRVRWALPDKDRKKSGAEPPAPSPWLVDYPEAKPLPWTVLSWKQRLKLVIWDFSVRFLLVGVFLFVLVLLYELISNAILLMLGEVMVKLLQNPTIAENPFGVLVGSMLFGVPSLDVTLLFTASSALTGGQVYTMAEAVYTVMGLNIGATFTAFFISLTFVTSRNKLRRAVCGATIYYVFNLLTVLVLLPLEFSVGMIYYLTDGIVNACGSSFDGQTVFFLRGGSTVIVKHIIQLDFAAISHLGSSGSARLMKINCSTPYPTTSEQITCPYLLFPLAEQLGDVTIGVILFIIAFICWWICFLLLLKLLSSILKGSIANSFRRGCQTREECLVDVIVFSIYFLITLFLQNQCILITVIIIFIARGIISRRRTYASIIGVSLGYATSFILIALSSRDHREIQLSLINIFLLLLGTIAWYPVPYLRHHVLNAGTYVGCTIGTYRWFTLPLLILIYLVLPLLFLGIAAGGAILFYTVTVPLFIIVISLLLINILQRKKPQVLPSSIRNWDNIPLWMHSLKPYDGLICKVSYQYKRKKQKVVAQRAQHKGDPLEFWERSRIYLYDWDGPHPQDTSFGGLTNSAGVR